MELEEFRVRGKEMVDFICDYYNNILKINVYPDVEPGFMEPLLPACAPEDPEDWVTIMKDLKDIIMKGVCHWQHPGFHAYFPSGYSFPSILGDLMASVTGGVGFSWMSNPASTELEFIICDWLGKALGLPSCFISIESTTNGGGIIHPSSNDCILNSMISARKNSIEYLKGDKSELENSNFVSRLVAYCSKNAHYGIQKIAKLLFVKLRILNPDENCCLMGETLKKAIEEDVAKGLTPFYVLVLFGETVCASFDNLEEIAEVCAKYRTIRIHVDASYGGCALICPEFRQLIKGLEHVFSISVNPCKWLLCKFDGCCFWMKDRATYISAFVINAVYLKSKYEALWDLRNYGIQLSRKFRSLKVWFVMRNYGISGLQNYISNHVKLAKYFKNFVVKDDRFELIHEPTFGVVCFRLRGSCAANQALLGKINASRKIHITPVTDGDRFVIKFCVNNQYSTEKNMDYAWRIIKKYAEEVLIGVGPTISSKYSFTLTVSHEIYLAHKNQQSLLDITSPIIVSESQSSSYDNSGSNLSCRSKISKSTISESGLSICSETEVESTSYKNYEM